MPRPRLELVPAPARARAPTLPEDASGAVPGYSRGHRSQDAAGWLLRACVQWAEAGALDTAPLWLGADVRRLTLYDQARTSIRMAMQWAGLPYPQPVTYSYSSVTFSLDGKTFRGVKSIEFRSRPERNELDPFQQPNRFGQQSCSRPCCCPDSAEEDGLE